MDKTEVIPLTLENLLAFIKNSVGSNMFRNFYANENGKKTDKLRYFINPKLTFESKEQNIIYEGCGSIGGLFGPVKRPAIVEVEATDEKGKKFRLKGDGILARVIQHEMDHLNGVEFLEKVSDYSKVITEEYYRKNIRNSKLQKKNSLITKVEYSS